MTKYLGLLTSEEPVLKSVCFHKYSVELPRDWSYDIIAKRLYLCCHDLLNKNILATYLVKEENGLQAWLLVYGILEESKLKDILAKRGLNLRQYEGEVELDPNENTKEFKNLLDLWISYKLSKVFRYDYELNAWFVRKHELEKKKGALCFRIQTEYTPKGYFILWIDPSIKVRYSLADYINDKLCEIRINFTIQEIGKNIELRRNPVIIKALEQIFEEITGEFAYGEGKIVNLVMFTKDGNKFVTKGRIESIIPSWTDQHPIKPTRRDFLSKKVTLLDFFETEKETLYDYLLKRKMKEKRKYYPEYPVVKVKTSTGSVLDFTPSDVLIQYREDKLTIPPKKRYEYFREIAERIQSNILIDFPFFSKPVKFIHKIPEEFKVKRIKWQDWRLKVIDNTGLKPLPMLREGGKPLGGPLKIHLIYIAPDIGDKEEIKEIISDKNKLLSQKFNEHNLGEIIGYSIKFYEWVELNVERTRENIRKALRSALAEKLELPEDVAIFPIIIGPSYREVSTTKMSREMPVSMENILR